MAKRRGQITEEMVPRLRDLWKQGKRAKAIARTLGAEFEAHITAAMVIGVSRRLNLQFGQSDPRPRTTLIQAPHVKEGRPKYRPISPETSPRVFTIGQNRKIGSKVQKGEWAGFPIYCLTLPERTTCPSSCEFYSGEHGVACYGDNMHLARRLEPGPVLEDFLAVNLYQLQAQHPEGFVVRLHILGDFYSPEYVQLWKRFLERMPALHIWGYTAYRCDSQDDRERRIALEIVDLRREQPDRFRVRTSSVDTVTLYEGDRLPKDALLCPAQASKSTTCATCAWCWERPEIIAFNAH